MSEPTGIRFVCKRHPRRVLGIFLLDDEGVLAEPLPDGTLPEDCNRGGKALALCPVCPTDYQRSYASIEVALRELADSGVRRVQTHRV